jgi:hypothetical protein
LSSLPGARREANDGGVYPGEICALVCTKDDHDGAGMASSNLVGGVVCGDAPLVSFLLRFSAKASMVPAGVDFLVEGLAREPCAACSAAAIGLGLVPFDFNSC